jgi:hypothetical protein
MTTPDPLSADEAFTVWINRPGRGNVFLARRGAQIKRGNFATKTVTLTDYGDKSTGKVSKRELRFRTHEHRKDEILKRPGGAKGMKLSAFSPSFNQR